MFLAPLFTISQYGSNPSALRKIDKCDDRCVYSHTHTHTHTHTQSGVLLSLQKKETLPFAATWMELDSIILTEVSQSEKDKYHTMSLLCGIYETKINK